MNDQRRRYGSHVVVITSLARSGEQVFHAAAVYGSRPSVSTRCGRELDDDCVRVHIDHASRFARPCRQCWRVQQMPLWAVA